jgi:hypothetical protein
MPIHLSTPRPGTDGNHSCGLRSTVAADEDSAAPLLTSVAWELGGGSGGPARFKRLEAQVTVGSHNCGSRVDKA